MKDSIADAWLPAGQCYNNVRSLCETMLLALLLSFVTLPVNSNTASEPVAVQMKSINLPGISEKGYRGRTAITPYVQIQSEDVIERFCGRWPRVIDSILIAFENAPVDLKDKAADLASRQD